MPLSSNTTNKVLIKNRTRIVLGHNHPSGKIELSVEDINLTNEIKEACKIFKIKLFDHIIVGNNNFYSFMDNGLL